MYDNCRNEAGTGEIHEGHEISVLNWYLTISRGCSLISEGK